jgi:putative ATP-binding cassette transporter
MSRLLIFLVRSVRVPFALAVVAGLAGGAGGVGLLALVAHALQPGVAPSGRRGLAFSVLCLATVAARVVTQVAMIRLAQRSVARLVRGLCESVLAIPLRAFESLEPGALLAVLTEDVAVLSQALSTVPSLVVNLAVLIGCLVYLGVVSPAVLLCTAVFLVPAVASQQLLTRRGRVLLDLARAEQDALTGHLRALVEGFKDLKLHRERRRDFLERSVRVASERVCVRNTAGHSAFALVSGWGQLLYFGYLGVLVFGLPALVDVPRESLAAAALTVVFAVSPLDGLLHGIPLLARAGVSLARVEELGLSIDSHASERDGPPPPPPEPLLRPLVLRGITYGYPADGEGEGFTLGPIDLTVRPGELLFLVGGNGSGKTTLIKLLTGLYPPASGTVRYNGNPVEHDSLEFYRGLFTAVFADGFLFPRLLGLNDPELDARAGRLIHELGLRGVVRLEDGAFSTTGLSQGQRKRLALLAACLEDRPILVLDEWASYQDPAFKRAFYKEILPALKARGKTLVVISHDEEYFHVADRVVHLTGGAVDDDAAAGARPRAVPS